MGKQNNYRKYYRFTYEELYTEELKNNDPFLAAFWAKRRFNQYASLFTRDMRKVLINENSSCAFCGVKSSLTIDHVIPKSKGGPNHPDNVQVLCGKCNRKKGVSHA